MSPTVQPATGGGCHHQVHWLGFPIRDAVKTVISHTLYKAQQLTEAIPASHTALLLCFFPTIIHVICALLRAISLQASPQMQHHLARGRQRTEPPPWNIPGGRLRNGISCFTRYLHLWLFQQGPIPTLWLPSSQTPARDTSRPGFSRTPLIPSPGGTPSREHPPTRHVGMLQMAVGAGDPRSWRGCY